MKYCTLARVRDDGRAGDFIRCDAVADDHKSGFTAGRSVCHVEGAVLPDDRTVAFGLVRGDMAGPYAEPVPCGHPEGTQDAASGRCPEGCAARAFDEQGYEDSSAVPGFHPPDAHPGRVQ